MEDTAYEVVERAAEPHHGLADVHELRRLRAERPYTQDPPRLEVEDQLEHPVQVAEDLPAGDFLLAYDPGLIGDRLHRQDALVATHPRALADRVDAERG